MPGIKSFPASFFRLLPLPLGLFVFFVGIFGFCPENCRAAGLIKEIADNRASALRVEPVAGLYELALEAGQSLQRSDWASSAILILLIVTSILCAFLTYFGIILLRIYKRDES